MAFEVKEIILLVHVAVGFGFLGLATNGFLAGAVLGASVRAIFGVAVIGLGFYLYRQRARQ
jgi:hypothetical protein